MKQLVDNQLSLRLWVLAKLNTHLSIDAMGTLRDLAEKILAAEADYILSLKGHQKYLFEDAQDPLPENMIAFTMRL